MRPRVLAAGGRLPVSDVERASHSLRGGVRAVVDVVGVGAAGVDPCAVAQVIAPADEARAVPSERPGAAGILVADSGTDLPRGDGRARSVREVADPGP